MKIKMNTTELIHHVVKIITLVYFHSGARLQQQDYFVLGKCRRRMKMISIFACQFLVLRIPSKES